jgi:hypothetical protein
MAAANGTSGLQFCSDLGISYRGLINLHGDALHAFASFCALSQTQLSDLVSWTGLAVGDVRMQFRNEVFVSRALRNPTMRGCPACLKEDIERDPANPLRVMVMRGDWQLRDVSTCLRHRQPLMDLWHDKSLPSRMDVGAHLTGLLKQISSGSMITAETSPTACDLWLDKRLADGRDETWLADQSLYAASTFLRLLGVELVRTGLANDWAELPPDRAAQAAGFDAANRGEAGIKDALKRLAALEPAGTSTPNKAFGQLYRDMARAYLAEESFAVFRGILREVILETWPIASGEDVLGELLEERRLYSINAAAQDAGIGPKLMGQLLVEAGALDEIDMGATFPAAPFQSLIDEIPQRVGNAEMWNAMGASRLEFEAMATDGVIRPRTRISTVKAPGLVSDGMALVEELDGLAIETDALGANWERLLRARARAGLGMDKLLRHIRKGALKLAMARGSTGFGAFHILKSEVDALKARYAQADPSREGLIAAAVFGRQIGLRDGGKFLKFLDAGHSPFQLIPVPNRRTPRRYLSAADIEAFRTKFVTPTMLMEETGLPRNTIVAQLKAEGVKPFMAEGECFGNVYLRVVVEPILAGHLNEPQREFSF